LWTALAIAAAAHFGAIVAVLVMTNSHAL
jgi:hypothetical protein